VEIRPRKGVFVRSITIEDVQEAAAVRVVLEKLATRLAMQNITPEDLLKLSAILKEMNEALMKPDIDLYTAVHYRFHRFIIDKSGNQVLSRAYSVVTEPFVTQRATYTYLKKRSKFEKASHDELYRALVQRDVNKLEELIEAHVMSVLNLNSH
jgi:DNA-binding GntR family transcriptional regulator